MAFGFRARDGSAANPAFRWADDLDSGFYRIGVDNVGLSLGGTKRWDFGTAGSTLTGALTVSGVTRLNSAMAWGVAPAASIGAWMYSDLALSGNTTQRAMYLQPTFGPGATTLIVGLDVAPITGGNGGTAYTINNAYGLRVQDASKHVDSTIANAFGLRIENITAGGTNYAIYTNGGAVRFGDAVTCASTLTASGTLTATGNVALCGTGSFGGGTPVVFLANAASVPTSNPAGGGILYSEAGALKWRSPGGKTTTIATNT